MRAPSSGARDSRRELSAGATSMMSSAGARCASARDNGGDAAAGHQRRQPVAGSGRPMTSVAQLSRLACSASCSATSEPVSTAVAAPSSSASLSTARMRSRSAAASLCSRGVSTYTACQRTLSWPARRAAVRTVCAAPSCGPTQARIAPDVFQACSPRPFPFPPAPGPDCSTRQPRTSSSTCSAVRRSAISRSAMRLPLRKKFCAARSACCGR